MEMAYKPKKQYSWLVPTSKVSADVAGAVMEKIEETQGTLTKENFLEASRPEESPTHKLFEWDNDKAAEKYRLVQSGRYIANLRITIVPSESRSQRVSARRDTDAETPYTVRAFMSVSPDRVDRGIFLNAESALKNAEHRKNVLLHAKCELTAFKKKYEAYNELAEVFDAIERWERRFA